MVLCALAFGPAPAYGQRGLLSEFGAWRDPSVAMVIGKVVKVTPPRQSLSQAPSLDAKVYYEFQVSEWLKPRDSGLPRSITITETWGATDTPVLAPGVEVVLFLQKSGDHFHSLREIYLDSPAGEGTLRGMRLFLRVMYTADRVQRRQVCLDSWNDTLSDPEKMAVLDAMWETRDSDYSKPLLAIALGNDSPPVREWALTILGSEDQSEDVTRLVPLLLREPECGVKRQLLGVFGVYRVREALPAIDEFLAGDAAGQCPGPGGTLRERAQEARDKITGKETRAGWRY